MKGVDGKEGRNQRASPERSGHPVEEEQQEERIGEVKQHAGEVVPRGIETEELTVQHV
jgi:hypothetical protein